MRDRALRFSKDCAKYRDGLEDAYANEVNFSESIKGFYGSLDDPFGNAVGGAILDKFMNAVQEIADARSMLLANVEGDLCARVRRMATADLDDVKDARKRFDRSSADHERARARFLSLTKDAKEGSLRAAEEELASTRRVFETARFNLMSKLHAVESRKRIEFKRQLAKTMDAHLRFFQLGHRILSDLEPFTQDVIARCEEDEADEELEQRRLASAMADYQMELGSASSKAPTDVEALSLTTDRSRSLAAIMAAADLGAQFPGVEGSESVGGRNVGGAGSSAGGVGGDQSRGGHMRQHSGGGGAVLTQGYLLKRSSNMRADWKRRFFVLDAHGQLTYYRDRDASSQPKETVSLLTATIKPDLEDSNMRFCFRVVSPEKTYCLQAESQADRARWMEAITTAIAGLLNSNHAIQGSVMSRLGSPEQARHHPRRGSNGHSRTGSFSGIFSFGNHGRSLSMGSAQSSDFSDTDTETGPSGPGGGGGPGHHRRGSSCLGGGVQSDMRVTLSDLRVGAPGNGVCADCGMVDPDWASLNLGVLLCIQCSGVHRQLGVHMSKVRSCTLDVRVWEPSVVAMFKAWGNERSNRVWEGTGHRETTGGDVGSSPDRPPATSSVDPALPNKPNPTASLEEKSVYIRAKYAERKFMSEDVGDWRADLLAAATAGDVPRTMTAIAVGGTNTGPEFDHLMGLALHAACTGGYLAMTEALVQNGADVSSRDVSGSTALHACVANNRDACAKLLIRRGATVGATDAKGRTPLDVAMERGHIKDEELFLMLSDVGGLDIAGH